VLTSVEIPDVTISQYLFRLFVRIPGFAGTAPTETLLAADAPAGNELIIRGL
jgi:hypothetical protein